MIISAQTKQILEEEYGCNSIKEYLRDLAEEYGADETDVRMLCLALGEEELFDGLRAAVADLEFMD